MRERLLLIDDDVELGRVLTKLFAGNGFDLEVALTVRAGAALARSGAHRLVLLDVMLPDGDGFELCRILRRELATPVLMLTACGTPSERVRGLELGADDYVEKPFDSRELIARVRALLRRHPTVSGAAGIAAKRADDRAEPRRHGRPPLVIDPSARRVVVHGREVPLTGLEFDLLRLLSDAPGRVLSRAAIIVGLHGASLHVMERSIDVHVSSLRRKVAAAGLRDVIKTVRGQGYVHCPPERLDIQ